MQQVTVVHNLTTSLSKYVMVGDNFTIYKLHITTPLLNSLSHVDKILDYRNILNYIFLTFSSSLICNETILFRK